MGMSVWIFAVCLCIVAFIFAIVGLLAIALAKAAAPRNAEEQAREDYEQMKALGYFDDTVTSGSPVVQK